MSFSRLEVMYGHIDGAQGKFAREPTGYLAIEAGIYHRHGLEVSWQHVQGTDERYRKLEDGSAQISFVVGRAALQHFLDSRTTRILGSSLNTCPYYLIAEPALRGIADLKGQSLACLEGVARIAPLSQTFLDNGLGERDVTLRPTPTDQDAFNLLTSGAVKAALLPRQFGFMAEEKGCHRIGTWPEVVDDPLPVMIETTASLLDKRKKDFFAFLEAHREGIRYLKANRAATLRMLSAKFAHSSSLAAKTFDDYLVLLDERLTIDLGQLATLLAQVAPNHRGGVQKLASEWLIPEAVRG